MSARPAPAAQWAVGLLASSSIGMARSSMVQPKVEGIVPGRSRLILAFLFRWIPVSERQLREVAHPCRAQRGERAALR
jgi:hypothetical protein